ncbi:response regulator [Frigidibacter sp. MR17.24]|uniref:response regulator n=1 Tax=Frigidibacter sp. MR17.24 TaxID=3127345 RepID=UPI003012A06A
MRILICEDNPVIAMDLEMTLEELGHEVVGTAASRAEANTGITLHRPDLVTIDLDLSDGPSGFYLLGDVETAGLRALIVSGQTSAYPELSQRAVVVPKPFVEADLVNAFALLAAEA